MYDSKNELYGSPMCWSDKVLLEMYNKVKDTTNDNKEDKVISIEEYKERYIKEILDDYIKEIQRNMPDCSINPFMFFNSHMSKEERTFLSAREIVERDLFDNIKEAQREKALKELDKIRYGIPNYTIKEKLGESDLIAGSFINGRSFFDVDGIDKTLCFYPNLLSCSRYHNIKVQPKIGIIKLRKQGRKKV